MVRDKRRSIEKVDVFTTPSGAKSAFVIVTLDEEYSYPSRTGKKSALKFIFDPTESLGEGAFGSVCKGYFVDAQNQVDWESPIAIKKFHQPSRTQAEAELNSRDYWVKCIDDQYILMPFYKNANTLDRHLKSVSPENTHERVDLGFQMAVLMQTMHSNTPKGPAIIHFDLKEDNILVTKDYESKNSQLTIIDFGLSSTVEKNDGRGTAGYSAPEVLALKPAGVSADNFTAGGLLAAILGAENILSSRFSSQGTEIKSSTFDTTGMLENDRNFTFLQKRAIKKYQSLMAHINKEVREEYANSDLNLRFMTSLRNLINLNTGFYTGSFDETRIQDEKNKHEAQIILLSNKINLASSFDFDCNPQLHKLIIRLEEGAGLLNLSFVKALSDEQYKEDIDYAVKGITDTKMVYLYLCFKAQYSGIRPEALSNQQLFEMLKLLIVSNNPKHSGLSEFIKDEIFQRMKEKQADFQNRFSLFRPSKQKIQNALSQIQLVLTGFLSEQELFSGENAETNRTILMGKEYREFTQPLIEIVKLEERREFCLQVPSFV